MCYWAVSHSAANSWAQINRLSALSRLGHLTSEVSFVNPLVSPSSIALVKNVSTITIPLRSTFGCSQGVHASVEMTFNLHRSLTLQGDGGVYVHVSWEYKQRLTEGDFLRFSKACSSLLLSPIPALQSTFQITPSQSSSPPPQRTFHPQSCGFLASPLADRDQKLGRHLLFWIQRLSTVLVFLPCANSRVYQLRLSCCCVWSPGSKGSTAFCIRV